MPSLRKRQKKFHHHRSTRSSIIHDIGSLIEEANRVEFYEQPRIFPRFSHPLGAHQQKSVAIFNDSDCWSGSGPPTSISRDVSTGEENWERQLFAFMRAHAVYTTPKEDNPTPTGDSPLLPIFQSPATPPTNANNAATATPCYTGNLNETPCSIACNTTTSSSSMEPDWEEEDQATLFGTGDSRSSKQIPTSTPLHSISTIPKASSAQSTGWSSCADDIENLVDVETSGSSLPPQPMEHTLSPFVNYARRQHDTTSFPTESSDSLLSAQHDRDDAMRRRRSQAPSPPPISEGDEEIEQQRNDEDDMFSSSTALTSSPSVNNSPSKSTPQRSEPKQTSAETRHAHFSDATAHPTVTVQRAAGCPVRSHSAPVMRHHATSRLTNTEIEEHHQAPRERESNMHHVASPHGIVGHPNVTIDGQSRRQYLKRKRGEPDIPEVATEGRTLDHNTLASTVTQEQGIPVVATNFEEPLSGVWQDPTSMEREGGEAFTTTPQPVPQPQDCSQHTQVTCSTSVRSTRSRLSRKSKATTQTEGSAVSVVDCREFTTCSGSTTATDDSSHPSPTTGSEPTTRSQRTEPQSHCSSGPACAVSYKVVEVLKRLRQAEKKTVSFAPGIGDSEDGDSDGPIASRVGRRRRTV
eukprot:TRINITY_DN3982_c0_g1_i1.p1 TRINITY_DN3982_c0_g1~~TRINITY_DN3982_c0_g1_i1.p1  ORF type:complete len:636 (-),score=57.98 TRINITY_DN3982_c0_g1_i1:67-1974(-)